MEYLRKEQERLANRQAELDAQEKERQKKLEKDREKIEQEKGRLNLQRRESLRELEEQKATVENEKAQLLHEKRKSLEDLAKKNALVEAEKNRLEQERKATQDEKDRLLKEKALLDEEKNRLDQAKKLTEEEKDRLLKELEDEKGRLLLERRVSQKEIARKKALVEQEKQTLQNARRRSLKELEEKKDLFKLQKRESLKTMIQTADAIEDKRRDLESEERELALRKKDSLRALRELEQARLRNQKEHEESLKELEERRQRIEEERKELDRVSRDISQKDRDFSKKAEVLSKYREVLKDEEKQLEIDKNDAQDRARREDHRVQIEIRTLVDSMAVNTTGDLWKRTLSSDPSSTQRIQPITANDLLDAKHSPALDQDGETRDGKEDEDAAKPKKKKTQEEKVAEKIRAMKLKRRLARKKAIADRKKAWMRLLAPKKKFTMEGKSIVVKPDSPKRKTSLKKRGSRSSLSDIRSPKSSQSPKSPKERKHVAIKIATSPKKNKGVTSPKKNMEESPKTSPSTPLTKKQPVPAVSAAEKKNDKKKISKAPRVHDSEPMPAARRKLSLRKAGSRSRLEPDKKRRPSDPKIDNEKKRTKARKTSKPAPAADEKLPNPAEKDVGPTVQKAPDADKDEEKDDLSHFQLTPFPFDRDPPETPSGRKSPTDLDQRGNPSEPIAEPTEPKPEPFPETPTRSPRSPRSPRSRRASSVSFTSPKGLRQNSTDMTDEELLKRLGVSPKSKPKKAKPTPTPALSRTPSRGHHRRTSSTNFTASPINSPKAKSARKPRARQKGFKQRKSRTPQPASPPTPTRKTFRISLAKPKRTTKRTKRTVSAPMAYEPDEWERGPAYELNLAPPGTRASPSVAFPKLHSQKSVDARIKSLRRKISWSPQKAVQVGQRGSHAGRRRMPLTFTKDPLGREDTDSEVPEDYMTRRYRARQRRNLDHA